LDVLSLLTLRAQIFTTIACPCRLRVINPGCYSCEDTVTDVELNPLRQLTHASTQFIYVDSPRRQR
jgi:hypothetical protein